MVSFTNILLSLSAAAASLAAPTEQGDVYKRDFNMVRPDFELTPEVASLMKRQDYNQNYKTSGNVQFSPRSNGYSVTFSNAGDFVVGKGWNTGSTRAINFNGTWSATAGTVMLTVYGWTKNPLIEYYIMEDYTSYQGGGQNMGSVTSDGSSYTIYKHQQVNQPSITGTATFWQYISVRNSKRTSGSVTTSNHFNAWNKLGMNLGSHSYQVVATEAWGNAAGKTDMNVS